MATGTSRFDARAVFVGCARDCEPFLARVLKNIERCAGLFRESAFVFVENDSTDRSRAMLEDFLARQLNGSAETNLRAHPESTLITLDGLAQRERLRSARLAVARNAYLQHLSTPALHGWEYLVAFDLDDVNDGEISLEEFAAAVSFLEEDRSRAAAFACSDPRYFDVWALRHPQWCPGDCWTEVQRARASMPYAVAVERHVHALQREIAKDAAPIRVQSAFGGLGIYRLSAALNGRYAGRTVLGVQTCEHVSFNSEVAKSGSLFIFPPLRNRAPRAHLGRMHARSG